MANPQKEHGYVKIANEYFDALLAMRLPGRVAQILLVVIRRTWGFNRKEAVITHADFEEATQMSRRMVVKSIVQAVGMNVITRHQDGKHFRYSVQKDHERWSPKGVPIDNVKSPKGVPIKANSRSPKGVPIGHDRSPKGVPTGHQKVYQPVTKKSPPTIKDNIKDNLKDTRSLSTAVASTSKSNINPHKFIIGYWHHRYQEHYGIDYAFRGGKDGNLIKNLLKRLHPELIIIAIDQLFLSQDDFYETGGGRTIGVLSANINKLLQEAKNGSGSGGSELSRHNNAVARRFLERHKDGK